MEKKSVNFEIAARLRKMVILAMNAITKNGYSKDNLTPLVIKVVTPSQGG